MAYRNQMSCFVCDRRFQIGVLSRINRDEDVAKREIAIRRREEFNRPPLLVNELTRICINCNRSIRDEILLNENNPSCLTLNVLTQTGSQTCVFCNGINDLQRLSTDCRIRVFVSRNIYIPEHVRTCLHHLNDRGLFPEPLMAGFVSLRRPYVLSGQQIQLFLENLGNVVLNENRYEHEDNFSDEYFKILAPLTKEQFNDLLTFCDPVPCQNGHRYVGRKELLIFLCKLRQALTDDFLKVMFKYSSRQAVSLAVATVRQSLMIRFVPQNIGFDAITREEYIERHVTAFANQLYNPQPAIPQVIGYHDGTYSYLDTSSCFRTGRQSFNPHKKRYLVKPALLFAPDGYILAIHGPYFSDSRNNDASMINNEFQRDANSTREFFQPGSILIVDRGYRDATVWLEQLGITWHMPALLEPGMRQLPTEAANDSRLITKTRWINEARNGHIKLTFKFLKNTIQVQHAPNLGDFYRIAGAIINKYHPSIEMNGANAETARELLRRAEEPNVLQALVELENLQARGGQRWILLSSDLVLDFPHLTLDFLRDLTAGVYQVNLAPAYIQDRLQRENNDVFELKDVNQRNCNAIPERGLIRVRSYSRFRNATKYQLWIAYVTTDEDEHDNDDSPILQYYCTRRAGARTLGCCSHVASVLWFLGYARHQNNVHYPSTTLLQAIEDAAHRAQPQNPI